MINLLTKSVADFLKIYKSQGSSALINCQLVPEFQKLVELVQEINQEHVGINKSNLNEYFKKNSISYFNILESTEFSIGVFCMAEGT